MLGEVRNPTTVWLLALLTGGFYGLYFYFEMGHELKSYLGREDLNPTLDVALALLCGVYGFYLPFKYGKIVQEAQQRAGISDARNQSLRIFFSMLVCFYGYATFQEELNKVWESGGATPATS